MENDFDFIAASLCAEGLPTWEDIRACLRACGGDDIRIIAKIENREGVDNLDAPSSPPPTASWWRGDLGGGDSAHEVPILQKKMIKATIR